MNITCFVLLDSLHAEFLPVAGSHHIVPSRAGQLPLLRLQRNRQAGHLDEGTKLPHVMRHEARDLMSTGHNFGEPLLRVHIATTVCEKSQ